MASKNTQKRKQKTRLKRGEIRTDRRSAKMSLRIATSSGGRYHA